MFAISAGVTVATFAAIGIIKGRMVGESPLAHAVETVLIGGGAAFLAFVVGYWTRALAA